MLNFKTIETLKPNSTIIDIIKCYDYKTKNGKVKILENTNLKFIEPTEYLISSPIKLTIYEYKVSERTIPLKYKKKGDYFVRCGVYVRVSTDDQKR